MAKTDKSIIKLVGDLFEYLTKKLLTVQHQFITNVIIIFAMSAGVQPEHNKYQGWRQGGGSGQGNEGCLVVVVAVVTMVLSLI